MFYPLCSFFPHLVIIDFSIFWHVQPIRIFFLIFHQNVLIFWGRWSIPERNFSLSISAFKATFFFTTPSFVSLLHIISDTNSLISVNCELFIVWTVLSTPKSSYHLTVRNCTVLCDSVALFQLNKNSIDVPELSSILLTIRNRRVLSNLPQKKMAIYSEVKEQLCYGGK